MHPVRRRAHRPSMQRGVMLSGHSKSAALAAVFPSISVLTRVLFVSQGIQYHEYTDRLPDVLSIMKIR